ncbi:MAG: glycosyltransferase [Patescibacteria group bacterium]
MISVIIPTLNEEELLPRLLEELTDDLRKRFRIEVIVSDGGSRDKTLKVARQHKARIVKKYSWEKQTIGSARNRGAWQARGDILVFIDADGYFQDSWYFFNHLKPIFKRQSVVACTVRIQVSPTERRISDWLWQYFINSLFYLENKLGMGLGRGNCQIVRADYFRTVGGYKENLVAGEDYDLFSRLKKYGGINFAWNLIVYESPRRFRKHGYWYVFWLWFLNFFSVIFRGRAWSKKWKRV